MTAAIVLLLVTILPVAVAGDPPSIGTPVVIQDSVLNEKLLKIESALRKGSDDSFSTLSELMVSLLFGGVPEAQKSLEMLARQHNEFQRVFGKNVGVERVGGIRLGDSLLSMVFVWKMKEASTIWYFNFYRSDAEWKLVSFASEPMTKFLDRPDKLLALGSAIQVSGREMVP